MASIHSEKKNGKVYYRLSVTINGERFRLGLGYDFAKEAVARLEVITSKLESLKMANEKLQDRKLVKEVSQLGQSIVDWFVTIGLLEAPIPRMSEFITEYIGTKHGIAEYTVYKLKKTAELLSDYFKNRRVTEVSRADVENFINHRRKLGLAEDSIRSEIKRGRQFFAYAKKKLLIDDNPFEGHKFHKTDLATRKVVIKATDLQKVISSAPCNNWKALLAILRWTGCRKSEAFKVKWSDVDFVTKTIRITSDKTKKSGKGFRELPLFPELESVLTAIRKSLEAPKESDFVVGGEIRPIKDKQGRMTVNLDKPFKSILASAGVKPWVKLFQNIRVTRENELIRAGYASHVVHAWMGHTRDVAESNYLAVTESDFKKALGGPLVGSTEEQEVAPATKHDAVPGLSAVLQGHAMMCSIGEPSQLPPTGLEPVIRL